MDLRYEIHPGTLRVEEAVDKGETEGVSWWKNVELKKKQKR